MNNVKIRFILAAAALTGILAVGGCSLPRLGGSGNSSSAQPTTEAVDSASGADINTVSSSNASTSSSDISSSPASPSVSSSSAESGTQSGGTKTLQAEPITEDGENTSEDYEPGTYTVDSGSLVNVRSEPDTSASLVGQLRPNSTVKVVSHTDGWYKVSYNGLTGYVKDTLLKKN